MKERVQKLMAQANVGSRRAAEELIRQERVRINGVTAKLGDQADPEHDIIEVDGERLRFDTKKRYFAINKPMNVLSSNTSNRNDERQPIRELIPYDGHLFTIGRLDAESDGLMVLTNDGEMANKLAHPRFEHTKTYKVVVYGSPTQDTLDRWEKGVYLDDGLTAPCSIRVQQRDPSVTVLKIVMIEGKKRQIRRVASLLEHPVKRLTRTHIGKLELGTLRHGEWYELKPEDLELMQTPGSDLSYIRKLRRAQRDIKHRDFMRQQAQPGSKSGASRERGDREDRGVRRSSLSRISGRTDSRSGTGGTGTSRTGKPGTGRTGTDKAGTGTGGTGTSRTGKPGTGRAGAGRTRTEKASTDESRTEQVRSPRSSRNERTSPNRTSVKRSFTGEGDAYDERRPRRRTAEPPTARSSEGDTAAPLPGGKSERGERSTSEVRKDRYKSRLRDEGDSASENKRSTTNSRKRPVSRRPAEDRATNSGERNSGETSGDRTERGNRGSRPSSKPTNAKRPGTSGRAQPSRGGSKPSGRKSPSSGQTNRSSGKPRSGKPGGSKRRSDDE